MYILKVYSIHYTLRQSTNVEKGSSGQNKRHKKCDLYFARVSTHQSFTFNLRFLHELKHKVCLSKTVRRISHFRFCFIFIKVYIFIQRNEWAF